MSTKPDVSVLMPAYNVSSYPPDLESRRPCVNQFGVKWELCLVDDGSTDGGLDHMKATDALKFARHDTNQGVAAALNTAAGMATGRYFIVQSVRSWYEPGALMAMAAALDDNPDVGFVYGITKYHGAERRMHIPRPFDPANFAPGFDSLFGYMYRREAWDAGCRYHPYIYKEGRHIDISDHDFVMQLIVDMGYRGLALQDRLTLNYYMSESGQMTHLVHRYNDEIYAIFRERWMS